MIASDVLNSDVICRNSSYDAKKPVRPRGREDDEAPARNRAEHENGADDSIRVGHLCRAESPVSFGIERAATPVDEARTRRERQSAREGQNRRVA